MASTSRRSWLVFLALILLLKGGSCQLRNSNQEVDDSSLVSSLLRGYNKLVAPDDTVTLHFGVYPVKIHEVDSGRGVLTVDLLFQQEWTDERLAWDVEEHGHGPVFFRAKHIYVPEVALYNGIMTTNIPDVEAVAYYYTGLLTYFPSFRAEVYCDLPEPPFVEKYCQIEIGPWSHDTRKTVLEVFDPVVDHSFVHNTGLCFIGSSTAEIRNLAYDCCSGLYFHTLVLHLNVSCRTDDEQPSSSQDRFFRSVAGSQDDLIQQTDSTTAKLSWHHIITPFFVLLVFLLPPRASDRIFLGTIVFVALLLLWTPGYTPTATTQGFLHLSAGVIMASILASLVACKLLPADPRQSMEPKYEDEPKTFACKSRLGVMIDLTLFISAAIVLGIAAAGTFA